MGKMKEKLLEVNPIEQNYTEYLEHCLSTFRDAIKRNCVQCMGYQRASKEAIKEVESCTMQQCPMHKLRIECLSMDGAE